MVVTITLNAELEPGFKHWFIRISTIAKAGGLSIQFFANELTIEELKKLNIQLTSPVAATYTSFSNWEDFLIMSRELKPNDFFVIVSSRKNQISYNQQLEKLPYYLSKYFTQNSFIIIYPKQLPPDFKHPDEEQTDHFLLEALADKVQVVNKAGNYIGRIFRRKK